MAIQYKIFDNTVSLPDNFNFGPGVSKKQNKKSVEEGFKKLEKWLKNPTPQNWNKIFGKNNTFGRQLRAYLLDEPIDLRKGTGLKETSKKVFDELNVKKLIKPADIEKINKLTTGGKGVSLRSIASKTLGNLKFSMADNIETIKNFQNGEAWLRANPDPTKVGSDGKNIYRKYANAIRGMEKESAKIGGFPFGNNSEKKLWSNLYRASYRGDRIKIVGEFADGNLPINKQGKVDWKMKNKAGVPAWERVKFIDTSLPGQPEFTWKNFKEQVDNVFGEGQFNKITAPYDVQVKTGSKRLTSGNYETIKNKTKVNLLRAELFLAKPGRFKEKQIPTEAEYNKYVNKKARGFNITEVHHPDGVGKNPWKMEPVFRYANREIEKVAQGLKSGKLNLDGAKLEIDRINNEIGPVRMKLDDGYYGTKLSTQKSIVGAADTYLDKFIQQVKSVPGGCRVVVTKALGGPIDACEAIIKADPKAAAMKLNNAITATKGPLKDLKETSKDVAKLIDTGQVTTASNLPRPDDAKLADTFKETNIRWNNDIGAFVTPNEDIASQADIKKYIAENPIEVKAGETPLKPATNKSVLANVGRTMAAVGAPLPTALIDSYFIGQQVKQGKGTAEIASNPLNWLGLATMEPLTKAAGIAEGDGLKKVLRLGLNPATIRGISRFAGLPGLAISTAMTAYDQYEKYKDGEGFIYKLFNKEGT